MTKEALTLALEALEAAYARLVTKCEQNLVTFNGVDVDTLTLSQEAITAIKEALQSNEQVEPCGGCGGSGWIPRDLDIGTDQECFVCDGAGAQPKEPEQEPVNKYCCHLCFKKSGQLFLDRMILCPECGNKRCPKATHHELPCTNSNEPNQTGSVYTTPPQRTWVGLTTDDWDEIKKQVKYNFEMTTGEYAERVSHLVENKLREKNT